LDLSDLSAIGARDIGAVVAATPERGKHAVNANRAAAAGRGASRAGAAPCEWINQTRRPPAIGCTPTEAGHVTTARHLDQQRIARARAGIVAFERDPQPDRFDSHDRVDLRIEGRWPSERLDTDGIAFEALALAIQGGGHDKAQEACKLGRGFEDWAR
jgi:hypothetical protein